MTMRQLLWGMMWRGAVWGVTVGALVGGIYSIVLPIIWFFAEWIFRGYRPRLPGDPTTSEETIYVLLNLALFIGRFGLPIGSLLGLAIGTLNGILIANLTPRVIQTCKDGLRYHRRIRRISAVLTFASIWFGVIVIFVRPIKDILELMSRIAILSVFVVPPSFIGGITAWFISHRLARWYERESAKGIAQNVSSN